MLDQLIYGLAVLGIIFGGPVWVVYFLSEVQEISDDRQKPPRGGRMIPIAVGA